MGEFLELIGIIAIAVIIGLFVLVFVSSVTQPAQDLVDSCVELGGTPDKTIFDHYNGKCLLEFEMDGYLIKSTAMLNSGGITLVESCDCCGEGD